MNIQQRISFASTRSKFEYPDFLEVQIQSFKEFFQLEGFKVIIHKESYEAQPHSEAIIKVRVGDQTELAAAEGNGPVNALDKALRKALERFYPQLSQIKLTDYKVRVLDSQSATAAKVRTGSRLLAKPAPRCSPT